MGVAAEGEGAGPGLVEGARGLAENDRDQGGEALGLGRVGADGVAAGLEEQLGQRAGAEAAVGADDPLLSALGRQAAETPEVEPRLLSDAPLTLYATLFFRDLRREGGEVDGDRWAEGRLGGGGRQVGEGGEEEAAVGGAQRLPRLPAPGAEVFHVTVEEDGDDARRLEAALGADVVLGGDVPGLARGGGFLCDEGLRTSSVLELPIPPPLPGPVSALYGIVACTLDRPLAALGAPPTSRRALLRDGRVAPGSRLPGAPADPDVRDSRIRLLDLRVRYGR